MVFSWLNETQEVMPRLQTLLQFWESEGQGDGEHDLGRPLAAWVMQCTYDYHASRGSPEDFDRDFTATMSQLLQSSPAYRTVMAPIMENLAVRTSAVNYPQLHSLCLHTRLRPKLTLKASPASSNHFKSSIP